MNKKKILKISIAFFGIFLILFVIIKSYYAEESINIATTSKNNNEISSSADIAQTFLNSNSISSEILKYINDTLNQTYTSRRVTGSSNGLFQISSSNQSLGAQTYYTNILYGIITNTDPPTLNDGTRDWNLIDAGVVQRGQIYNLIGSQNGLNFTVSSKQIVKRIFPTVLTLGDSITFSNKGDWNNNQDPGWGMKASAENKDYVHLILNALKGADNRNAVNIYSSHGSGQAGGKLLDVVNMIETWKSYHPDLVTIQIGENDNSEQMYDSVNKEMTGTYKYLFEYLLDQLLDNSPAPRIFCFGDWNPDGNYVNDFAYAVEKTNSELCLKKNLPFKSIKDIALDQNNHDPDGTGGLSNGINWHPNDNGMRGYFNLFWEVLGPEVIGIAQ